jgi:hypothetical protein
MTEENDNPPAVEQLVINLKVGEFDRFGQKVSRIFAATHNYVIYETDNTELQTDGHDERYANDLAVQKLLASIAKYNTLAVRKRFNCIYAHAIKMAIEGHSDVAQEELTAMVGQMQAFVLGTRQSQVAYAVGAVSVLSLSLALFGFSWLCIPWLSSFGIQIWVAIVFAAMGGVMSVAIGSSKLNLDIAQEFYVNMGYGSLRIVIAIIAGVVSLFLIESGVVFAFLKESESSHYGFAIAAFLSGFSEMYVPNAMKKLADKS